MGNNWPCASRSDPDMITGAHPTGPNDISVMGKYIMHMGEEDIMGEGTSSICRVGTDRASGKRIAVKVYKSRRNESSDVTLKKFRRQIEVLQDLMKPLEVPQDKRLWCPLLERATPDKLFMQLIDFSKDAHGQPGPDPGDNQMYVVTEIASYSLKEYLRHRRDERKPLSKETVRSMTKAVIAVTAGLHAKGLVHLDLKPENLMVFDGCLKLIDVDGCVKIGTTIPITDSSLSFSPCYCAPEWANFLIDESDLPTILARDGLDVWSIGMTILEFVCLEPALKATYASWMRNGRSSREAGFLFLEWLSALRKSPIPRSVERFDPQLASLLTTHLLECNPDKRHSLAESLAHPYLAHVELKKSGSGPLTTMAGDEPQASTGANQAHGLPQANPRYRRHRQEAGEDGVVFKGKLWKLNSGADPQSAKNWLERDMWITDHGALCYFSEKENKKLVLLDANSMSNAEVETFSQGAKIAFQIRVDHEHGHHETHGPDVYVFGVDNVEECGKWMKQLEMAKMHTLQTFHLGDGIHNEFKQIRVSVKNRRGEIKQEKGEHNFDPVFKAKLWKLKADSDRKDPKSWFQRDMWIAQNHCLCYHSERQEQDLVYYTCEDVTHSTVKRVPNGTSCKNWEFLVELAPSGGVEFAPGEFAAESEELREKWIAEFERQQGRRRPA